MSAAKPINWPFDASPDEVESRAELDAHLTTGSLANLIIQGLRLDADPPDFTSVDLTNTVFVGCRFASREVVADLILRGANVVPAFDDVPYPTAPSRLYTPDDLAEGFAEGGFLGMYDTVVYEHFRKHGGALPDIREALAERIHDSGMDDALADAASAWVDERGASTVVGIMGGHTEVRGSVPYRLAATLAWRLAGTGRLVVTGGGPGVMEAANLGAYLSQHSPDDLHQAIDDLSKAPDFTDHDNYTATALAVRAAYQKPECDLITQLTLGGLSIPTWLYGHEPANLFAGGIAKYFSNAIREDTILRLARGGIVFAPGRAGTVQEVFQAATKTFYITDGASGPFVFLGRSFWSELPAPELLCTLLAASPHGDLSGLVHVIDDLDEALALLTH